MTSTSIATHFLGCIVGDLLGCSWEMCSSYAIAISIATAIAIATTIASAIATATLLLLVPGTWYSIQFAFFANPERTRSGLDELRPGSHLVYITFVQTVPH